MMITVSLSVAELRALQQIARMKTQYFDGMEPEELLRCFVGDLVQSGYSGDSDERMYAWQWIERRFGPREPVTASMFEKNPAAVSGKHKPLTSNNKKPNYHE